MRHFTCLRRDVLVRLACVKPAASVRSEPGSNSPVRSFESFDSNSFILFFWFHQIQINEGHYSVFKDRPKVGTPLGRCSQWSGVPLYAQNAYCQSHRCERAGGLRRPPAHKSCDSLFREREDIDRPQGRQVGSGCFSQEPSRKHKNLIISATWVAEKDPVFTPAFPESARS